MPRTHPLPCREGLSRLHRQPLPHDLWKVLRTGHVEVMVIPKDHHAARGQGVSIQEHSVHGDAMIVILVLPACWKRAALTEPDPRKRAAYQDMALVFAELSKELVNWQQALEGWQMLESQVVNNWINQGELKGLLKARRADLLKLLSARLPSPVPKAVRLAIEGTNDPETLDRWFDAALHVPSWAEFRAAMQGAE